MEIPGESSVYDERSMERTYYAMRLKIMNHAYRLTRDVGQSEDICQATFEAAVRQWQGPEEKRAPFTADKTEHDRERWLYRISTYKSVDYIRSISQINKQGMPLKTDALIALTSYLPSLEEQVLLRDELRVALAQLPADDVELLICHYGLGYSLEELGAESGVRPGAMKKRRWRAKKALEQALGNLSIPTKGRNL